MLGKAKQVHTRRGAIHIRRYVSFCGCPHPYSLTELYLGRGPTFTGHCLRTVQLRPECGRNVRWWCPDQRMCTRPVLKNWWPHDHLRTRRIRTRHKPSSTIYNSSSRRVYRKNVESSWKMPIKIRPAYCWVRVVVRLRRAPDLEPRLRLWRRRRLEHDEFELLEIIPEAAAAAAAVAVT